MRNTKEIMHFGTRLKKLRQQAKLTQGQLAFEAEVDIKTIRRTEKGVHAISLDYIITLSKALGVQPGSFFEGMKIEFEE